MQNMLNVSSKDVFSSNTVKGELCVEIDLKACNFFGRTVRTIFHFDGSNCAKIPRESMKYFLIMDNNDNKFMYNGNIII